MIGRGDMGIWGVMSTDNVFALAVGFAIAGCWSLISGTVVVLALAAFGFHGG
jgi:hypothetical protein